MTSSPPKWDSLMVHFVKTQSENPASPDGDRFRKLLKKAEANTPPSSEDVGFLVHHLEFAARELRTMYEAEADVNEANELMELAKRLSNR